MWRDGHLRGWRRALLGFGHWCGPDANDRVIYNTSGGQLYYDADGNGSGAAQLVATVTGAPSVVATDIAVI